MAGIPIKQQLLHALKQYAPDSQACIAIARAALHYSDIIPLNRVCPGGSRAKYKAQEIAGGAIASLEMYHDSSIDDMVDRAMIDSFKTTFPRTIPRAGITLYETIGAIAQAYPLITHCQERYFIRNIQNNKNPQESAGHLFNSHVRFMMQQVIKLADPDWYDEALSAASSAFMESVVRFDLERHMRFTTYWSHYIKRNILDHMRESSIIYIPEKPYLTMKMIVGNQRCQEYFCDAASRLGFDASTIKLARLARQAHHCFSYDTTHTDKNPLIDVLSERQEENHEHLLAGIMSQLEPYERDLLSMRYGLQGPPMTLEQLGKQFNMSYEGVRLHEKRIIQKARQLAMKFE